MLGCSTNVHALPQPGPAPRTDTEGLGIYRSTLLGVTPHTWHAPSENAYACSVRIYQSFQKFLFSIIVRAHDATVWWAITHPLSSKNRHITFATISSFFSSGALLFILVRAACLSDEVAPKQSAKSMVDDCKLNSINSLSHTDRDQRATYILPPQFILNNRVRNIPSGDTLRQLSCLRRAVPNRLLRMRRRLFEPEMSYHRFLSPKAMQNATYQS